MLAPDVAPLVEHFFRHEAGRLQAVLTRLFGWRHADLVEEMVQATLLAALQSWRTRGVPDNPSAWIHRVAKNRILDALRNVEGGRRALREWAAARPTTHKSIDDLFVDTEIEDSQLRLMFACCHPTLARHEQLALTLKTLCGFADSEIARALLVSEEAVKKRLQRAKRQLVDADVALEAPSAEDLPARLEGVHQVLYLLFNEGYCPSRGEAAVRVELCEEAARLCHLLCAHRRCSRPATFALLALMLFHAARFDARLDGRGCVLLLEDQDRGKWDRRMICRAKEFLDHSAAGDEVSPYHLEAGIAFYHSSAPSYQQTNWTIILGLYDALVRWHPSPIYLLNRAVVVAQLHGPAAGIQALQEHDVVAALAGYHLADAVLGELYRRTGDMDSARRHLTAARAKTASPSDHEILDRRLNQC